MKKLIAALGVALAVTLGAASPAAAFYPPPPVYSSRDWRPPLVPARPFNPYIFPTRNRATVKGLFFMGYNERGRRVCWVTYTDGTHALVLDAC